MKHRIIVAVMGLGLLLGCNRQEVIRETSDAEALVIEDSETKEPEVVDDIESDLFSSIETLQYRNMMLELAARYQEEYIEASQDEDEVRWDKETLNKIVKDIAERGYCVFSDNINFQNGDNVTAFAETVGAPGQNDLPVIAVNNDTSFFCYMFRSADDQMERLFINVWWDENNEPVIRYAGIVDVDLLRVNDYGYCAYRIIDYIEQEKKLPYDDFLIKQINDECRTLKDQYVSTLSYTACGIMIEDWDEESLDQLNYNVIIRYIAWMEYGYDIMDSLENGQMNGEEFERIITKHFDIIPEFLREAAEYDEENEVYPVYKQRNSEFEPKSEVVKVEKLDNGDLLLTIEACWFYEASDSGMVHELTIRLNDDGSCTYLANKVIGGDKKIVNDEEIYLTK